MLECATLWIGETVGPVERACMRSVLRQGHHLALYCYRVPSGIPPGVQLADASAILPPASVFRHRSGSIAPFSDWFRYELQKRGLGTWVDTDMYLLRPLDESGAYLFGEERPGIINNAVLRLPPDSPIIGELLKLFRPAGAQPRALLSELRDRLSGRMNIRAGRWGTTGRVALTAAVNKFALASHALPASAFYPVPWQRADWIIDRQIHLEDLLGESTIGVHLWNQLIKGIKNRPAPEGSFLARLQTEGA